MANPIAYQSMVEKHADQLKALTDDIEVLNILEIVPRKNFKILFNNWYETVNSHVEEFIELKKYIQSFKMLYLSSSIFF